MAQENDHKKMNRPNDRDKEMLEFLNFLNAIIAYSLLATVLGGLMILF